MPAGVAATKTGDGFDASVDYGPMINAGAIDTISGLVDAAVAEGATTSSPKTWLKGSARPSVLKPEWLASTAVRCRTPQPPSAA